MSKLTEIIVELGGSILDDRSISRKVILDLDIEADLGIDSIDLLALAVDLEENIDVVITDRDLSRIRTVGDTILCIVGELELRRIGCGAASVGRTIEERPTR